MTYNLCRDDRIRTCDLVVPNDARYRAALHPEVPIWERKCKKVFYLLPIFIYILFCGNVLLPKAPRPARCSQASAMALAFSSGGFMLSTSKSYFVKV